MPISFEGVLDMVVIAGILMWALTVIGVALFAGEPVTANEPAVPVEEGRSL